MFLNQDGNRESIRSSWSDGRNPLFVAISVAVLFRLTVFVGSIFWPIPNENLVPVSPLSNQGYFDFAFYLDSLHQYRTLHPMELLGKFVEFYQRPLDSQFGHIIAGPVFPLLIGIFDYAEGQTLPMALFYLSVDCVWSIAWLWWFARRRLPFAWMVVFALAPNPVWFMLVVSPDLIFAALIGFFYVLYFSDRRSPASNAAWIGLVLLILLTRPNGYSILLFVLADGAWRHFRVKRIDVWTIAAFLGMAILFGLYLYPYFITEMRKSAADHVFFGLPTSAFIGGVFASLPEWLNIVVSWLALAIARVLYFVGLRPSYGATPELLVILRALPGMILLPGLVWGLMRGGGRQAMFLALFCLPVFLGPSQDRYNLPVYPLLFFFGAQAYMAAWRRLQPMYSRLGDRASQSDAAS